MNSGVLQSHTATQQWQSFEIRMRRRRVERCVLRASVAIEAGVLDDARAALEEVQRLDPYEPALETLRTQLTSAAEAHCRASALLTASTAPVPSSTFPSRNAGDPPKNRNPATCGATRWRACCWWRPLEPGAGSG